MTMMRGTSRKPTEAWSSNGPLLIDHQTNVAVLLLLLIAWLCIEALERPTIGWKLGVGLGVVSALATLNRSEMLVVAPALIVGVACWRRAPRLALVAGLAFALTLSPWVARNWVVFHRFVPAAQSSGYNLWKGFNPYTNGSGRFSETYPPSAEAAERIRETVRPGPLYEPRVQDAFLTAAKSYIANAGAVRLVQLTATKIVLLWGLDWKDPKITGGWAYRLPWVVSNLLALAGALALWRSRRADLRAVAVMAALLLLLTAGYAATDVHSRYRMHIEPFLFMLDGVGLEACVLMPTRRAAPAIEPLLDHRQ